MTHCKPLVAQSLLFLMGSAFNKDRQAADKSVILVAQSLLFLMGSAFNKDRQAAKHQDKRTVLCSLVILILILSTLSDLEHPKYQCFAVRS